ncbi:MAG: CoA-binding protein [Candidatus Helarchaeota archaeon]|nr:CoA-binding protein [Candidatus Helarchaeota archaeon]
MTDFNKLFSPSSIAIIGASTQFLNFGSTFFTDALAQLGYKGKVYYINPKHEGEIINGEKILKSLDEVNEKVDVVYSCIRAALVPDLVRQCVKRGDRFIVVFTSGFSEVSLKEGTAREEDLLAILKGSETRIIGPNCLGPYNPSIGVGWNAGLDPPKEKGNVAFVSQSGGHATTLLQVSPSRGFYYSKGLSFGNQIDINCEEILNFYGNDPETEVIALYLEDTGTANGHSFFKKLKEVSLKKPVILWKGGQTATGARAAASHTGAMSGSFEIWRSMAKQAGGIFVEQSEEFWDMIHLCSTLLPHRRLQECKSLGLIIPGGGNCVEATDLFSRYGFNIPVLGKETQEHLAKLMPDVNTSVKNPVDLGASGTLEQVFLNSVRLVAEDPSVDWVIHFQPMDWIAETAARVAGPGYSRAEARSIGRLAKKLEKPLIQLSPVLQIDSKVAEIYTPFMEILRKMGVPNFSSMPRLATALKLLNGYLAFLKKYKN